MLRITNATEGFRRGGVAHPKGVTEYRDDFFTAAQIDQLKAEPRLVVEVLADKPQGNKKKDEDKA